MANTCSGMTDKKAYSLMMIAQQCNRNRRVCEKKCLACPYSVDILELDKAYNHVLDILKARNPELYLMTELEELDLFKENALDSFNRRHKDV